MIKQEIGFEPPLVFTNSRRLLLMKSRLRKQATIVYTKYNATSRGMQYGNFNFRILFIKREIKNFELL